jgi:cytochrome P450
MPAKRDNISIPAWSQDQLDSPGPPTIEAAYFDDHLRAWVLSRHADILAAFRASSLSPVSPHDHKESELADETKRLQMRSEAMEALSAAQLHSWREQIAAEAEALANSLPTAGPVDLMDGYARPLCLSLASMVTGIARGAAEGLCHLAQQTSAAAAEPYDPAVRLDAKSANAQLRSCFHSGPEALRDAGFVALSQTLPCLLGNVWFGLTQFPQEWSLLHRQPELTEQAVEELLRYAGLARILFRMATADLDLNGARIRKGERIILRIIAANRDPERFSDPNRVDVTRRDGGHFSLGAGPHACVGAGLIRMSATTLTYPLLRRFAAASLALPMEWQGGSGFRSPRSLWVSFTRQDQSV